MGQTQRERIIEGNHLTYMFDMLYYTNDIPDSKVHEANMEPIWGRQDPDGPDVGPMNFAIWDMLAPRRREVLHILRALIGKNYSK